MTRILAAAAACAMLGAAPALAPVGAHAQGGAPSPSPAAKPVRFCGGVKGGNYEYSGIQTIKQLAGTVPTELVATDGALDNLGRIDRGECDVGVAQIDAYAVYMAQNPRSTLNLELGRALYPEYLHLICNTASGITRITQLTEKNTVLIGPKGGGSAVTWESFRLADPKRYRPVRTLPYGGAAAVGKVQQGDEAQCMVFVAGLKTKPVNDANTVALQSDGKLALVAADDSDLPGHKDAKGHTLYARADIPSGTYPGGLQPRSVFGSAVSTIAVNAVVVFNSAFAASRKDDYEAMLDAINKAAGDIRKQASPQ